MRRLFLTEREWFLRRFFFIEDLLRGEIPLTAVSEIRGGLGIVLFDLPIKAKLSCEVVMNTHNQTIERQDCCPA
ncbi:hypothetical protein HanXRQr2_Chr10g0454611 [Helianthus annuus]|uniref:Uncharacterized protein n=1 Tax=Helianthus annuus TaxID=4232 RepID=A0A251TMJ9_HELAN|nr:hypothetical protein HanXRQr2_Chr10g0454611 [Helianthus annuus]KAJ0514811.1 hypothetical protein HanHA300_Chr10g0373771 [Helianthus annuus]KAJ0523117.1 hypothetical protein HanIR_Chr10g0490231 [Helianthus annuus]KAJ0530976.1 hypothetical protein HanHA89_Chr10g0396001 [Helianthus annuus]KAJ0701199.1 hypothetical protein HanOQP8_Chr10g0376751 [Helianthus annuus]